MIKLVKQIVLDLYKDIPLSISDAGEGFYGRVFKVTLSKEPFSLCIKFFKNEKYMFLQEKEQNFINKFHAIKIPKVINIYQNKNINALVMEWIDGENLGYINMFNEPIKEKIGWEIVKESIALHNINNKTFGYINDKQYLSWQEFYLNLSKEMLKRIEISKNKDLLDEDSFNLMKYVYKKFDYIFSEEVNEASLIHGDLNITNIIVKDNQLAAIIDPMGVMWGDREIELFQFECSGSDKFNLLEKYFSIKKPSKKFELKNAYYKAFAEANHYARINKVNDNNLTEILINLEKTIIKYNL